MVDLADVLGESMFAFAEGTIMRGEAERARGAACKICFGRGGRGRFIGGRGAMRGILFGERWHGIAAGLYFVAGSRGKEVIWAISSDEAWMVISSECVVIAVVLDVCRECRFGEDLADMLDTSVSDCDELSSISSSGMDSVFRFGEALSVDGMNVQGMDSFIRSSSFGADGCVSHSSSFFATHGFCVHLSFEKYALQACIFESGWP